MADTSNTQPTKRPKHGRHMAAAGSMPSSKVSSTRLPSSDLPARQLGTPQSAANRESLRMQLPTTDVGADSTSAWIPSNADNPESESPRPIGVDPAATGSFQRLSVGEGAHITTRETAEMGRTAAMTALKVDNHRISNTSRPKVESRQTKEQHDHRIYIVLAVFAVLLAVGGFIFVRHLTSDRNSAGSDAPAAQTQADIGQAISYGGATYALMQQGDGSYVLTYQPEEANSPQSLCTLTGIPVQLYLYNGTFVIPENTGESWDVVAFMRGISVEATPVTNEAGEPVSGEGSIEATSLDGATLHITLSSGETVDVNLE